MAPVDKSLVLEKIDFAKRRLADLVALGDRFFSHPPERRQPTEEFFFHTVGAVEMVAQLVNQGRGLGKSTEMVSPSSVAAALPAGDPIVHLLAALCANPKKEPMPPDPYGDAGYIWRLWNYRHQVNHRGRNPFDFSIGGGPKASLRLD